MKQKIRELNAIKLTKELSDLIFIPSSIIRATIKLDRERSLLGISKLERAYCYSGAILIEAVRIGCYYSLYKLI